MATWGQQTWGFQNWGTLGDQNLTLGSISLSATLSVVQVDNEIQIGWGGDSWGENSWGELSGAFVDVSGISLTANIGAISIFGNALVEPSGISTGFSVGQITQRIDVDVILTDGVEAQTLIGDAAYASKVTVSGISTQTNTGQITVDPAFLIGEGWGRDTFGNLGWGVNYSAIGGGVNGLSISTSIGNEDAFTDVVIDVSGLELSADITPVGTSATSDNEIAHSFLLNQDLGSVSIEGTGFVSLTGIALSSAIGEAEAGLKTEVPVTGISLQTSLGDLQEITGDGFVELTGIGSTYTIGNSTPVSGYDLSGISATYATPGNVVATGGATVVPTGIGLTITVTSPNIIAWAEVDVGTEVTWTVVDLAA